MMNDDETDSGLLSMALAVLDTYLFNALTPSHYKRAISLKNDELSAFHEAYTVAGAYQYQAMDKSGITPTSMVGEEYSVDFNYKVSPHVVNMGGVLINGLSKSILDRALFTEGLGGGIL